MGEPRASPSQNDRANRKGRLHGGGVDVDLKFQLMIPLCWRSKGK